MTTGITGLVNTRNAAATLATCLASLASWVDEIVVVDMRSDDGTREIAAQFGAVVVDHEPLGYVEPARAAGVAAASNEWIVILDADEVIPATLAARLRSVATNDEADYVVYSWRNYFFGAVLEWGPFGPRTDRHARFFKRWALVHPAAMHQPPQPQPGARLLILPPSEDLCVSHFAYVDVSDWFARMDRYTTVEARAAVSTSSAAPRTVRLLARTLHRFYRGYVSERGYRDGWRGLHACLLLALYQLTTGLKAQQLARAGTPEQVVDGYRRVAGELSQHP